MRLFFISGVRKKKKVFYEPSVCSQSIWTEGFEELIGWNKINGTYDENYDYYGYYSDGYYYGDGSNGEISEDKTAPVITITSGVMPDQTVILDRIQAEIIVSANENIERFNCLGSGVTCLLSDEKKLIIFIDSTENNPAGIEVLVFDAAGIKVTSSQAAGFDINFFNFGRPKHFFEEKTLAN